MSNKNPSHTPYPHFPPNSHTRSSAEPPHPLPPCHHIRNHHLLCRRVTTSAKPPPPLSE
ncbi:hypothetical protein Hanom_Chr13g01218101 [Helianthus anomalus]